MTVLFYCHDSTCHMHCSSRQCQARSKPALHSCLLWRPAAMHIHMHKGLLVNDLDSCSSQCLLLCFVPACLAPQQAFHVSIGVIQQCVPAVTAAKEYSIFQFICLCHAGLPRVRSSFLAEDAEPPAEEQELSPPGRKHQHGGTRAILLQPPVFLLFDDPATSQSFSKERPMVAGRLAKIRYATCCSLTVLQLSKQLVPISLRAGLKQDAQMHGCNGLLR